MTPRHLNIIRKTAFVLSLILVAAGYYLWTSSAGDIWDDVLYSHCFEIPENPDDPEADFYGVKGERIASLDDVVRSARNHYIYWDNGRLANTIMFAMELVPYPAVHTLCTGAFLLMVLLMLRAGTGRRWVRPLLFTLLTLGVFVTFPTHALYKAVDFQINYVWTSVAVLLFWLLVEKWYSGCRTWQGVLLCLLAAPAGCMHEGFSVPALIGLGLYVLLRIKRSERPSKWVWAALGVMLVFTLVITFAPSVLNRAGREVSGGDILAGSIRRVVRLYWIIPLTLLFVLLTGLRRGGLKGLWHLCRENIFAIAMVVCNTGITIAANSERSVWPAVLFSLVLLVRVFARPQTERRGALGCVAAVLLSAGLCAYLIGLGHYQKIMFEEHERIMEASRRSQGNLFYSNLKNISDLPFWYGDASLGIDTSLGVRAMVFSASKHRLRPYWEENCVVLPLKYAGIPLDSLPRVEGTAGLRGEYPTYYSAHRFFPKPVEARSFRITVGAPDYQAPYSFNPVRRLLELPSIMRGRGDSVLMEVSVIPMALEVTEGMRRQGIAHGDSVWFYWFEPIPREAGRPILRIDTIP